MKTALFKDGVKEITKSYKRFLSILLIVLLGVGFFAGLKVASPDMRKTLDKYFDELQVMDIQVLSTLGLTDEDVTAIADLENIEKAEGSYQTDAIVNLEEEEVVVKLESILDNINKLEIVEGRLPENKNECVVEPNFLLGTGYNLGDTIEIEVENTTNDDGEEIKVLKQSKVTIVGTVKSPLYIYTDRGNTKLGSGVIDYFLYVPKENINPEIYTNIYVTVEGARDLETTENKYEDIVGKVEDELEAISEERREARYNELYESTNSKIEDAQEKLDEETEKAEKELNNAEKEIKDGKKEIASGREELESNRAEANKKFTDAEAQLKDAKETLKQNEKKFNEEKKKAEELISTYQEQLEELKQTQTQLNTLKNSLNQAQSGLQALNAQLETATEAEKPVIQAQITELNTQIQTLQNTILVIENTLKEQGVEDLDSTITLITTSISTAKQELKDGEKQLTDGKNELEENEKELAEQKNSTYYQLEQAEAELDEAEEEIKDGEKELEDARKEFEEEISKAEDELLDAKEELKKLERPEWYILDRDENMGYASYVQDTDRVASLAQVFPVVFFLVAALISLTSMSRMVEEERVQIGTLKALGYAKRQIAAKYIIYASLATLIGGGIGLIIGFKFLPKIIANMYGMVYTLPPVILDFNMEVATMDMAFAIICTVGATVYTCIMQLKNNPATLMRPKAPKPGKRVILEKIPFIWKRLNFTAKVTARNLFRYKKRFLMTIIGVCGCTSLIIAGFGLRDAIANMIPKQFGVINKYNINISLKNDKYGEELVNLEKSLTESEEITSVIGVNIQSVKIIKDDNNQNIQMIIPEDVNRLEEFISLHDRKKQDETYVLDNTGVIISEKLSNLLNIEIGDTILIENADGDRKEVQVAKVTENYLMHYIYISPELYNQIFDTRIESNVILAKTNDLTLEQEEDLGRRLLEDSENVSGVTFTSASEDMFAVVMENLDMVVWILIIAAGLLAFVVLYNLLNANISERVRELATIKVLGFYDREVYSYIARETIILTILGMLLGLAGGYFLTMYILKTCELDITMFDPDVRALSYILGIVITVFFAIIVNIITYFSLKKIDMIESLKSVE